MKYNIGGVTTDLTTVKGVMQHKKKVVITYNNGNRLVTTFRGEKIANEAYIDMKHAMAKYRKQSGEINEQE